MSYVYFIGPAFKHRRIKIGFTSRNVDRRISDLQTAAPWPLQVHAYVEGGIDLERALHATFSPMHLHGEWFWMNYKLAGLVSDLELSIIEGRPATQKEFWHAFRREVRRNESWCGDPTEGDLWQHSARPQALLCHWEASA